jgi:hypothetical protein
MESNMQYCYYFLFRRIFFQWKMLHEKIEEHDVWFIMRLGDS